MNITNHHVKTDGGVETLVLTGSGGSTVIKSLELISGSDAAVVDVVRKDADDAEYGRIRVNLTAYNYVMLWEGFVVIPNGHKLYVSSDSHLIEAVANVVEL